MLGRALVVWLAFLLLAHGIAHVPGFLVNWQIASFPDLTYRTTIFATSVDVCSGGRGKCPRSVGMTASMTSCPDASYAKRSTPPNR